MGQVGWDWDGWLSYVVGSLSAPSVLINQKGKKIKDNTLLQKSPHICPLCPSWPGSFHNGGGGEEKRKKIVNVFTMQDGIITMKSWTDWFTCVRTCVSYFASGSQLLTYIQTMNFASKINQSIKVTCYHCHH